MSDLTSFMTKYILSDFSLSFSHMQGTHCTGKTGKMAKHIPSQRKDREFGNFVKTQGKQGIRFAQVVNSLIIKAKDISIFPMKIFNFFLKLDKSAKSDLRMC